MLSLGKLDTNTYASVARWRLESLEVFWLNILEETEGNLFLIFFSSAFYTYNKTLLNNVACPVKKAQNNRNIQEG